MSLTTITKNCHECGKSFSLTAEEQQKFIDKGLSEPKRCPSCRTKRRNVEIFTCTACGRDFEFNQLEREWYAGKGFLPPKRCLPCRKNNRAKEATGK